ncbi:MAG: HAD hydrolase-like protein [Alphaproteobacteria bacterium]|nr:HAD hydrolase-like protein [Alphaproteobacteria bacterium]
MDIGQDIFSVAEEYDTLFIDVYGVLYNGMSLYNGTLDTMEALRKSGKRLIIVSNSSLVANDAKIGYEQRGMIEGVHYDKCVTSGEYLNFCFVTKGKDLFRKQGISVTKIKCLFLGNSNIFVDSQIPKSDLFDEADLMYVGVPIASYGRVLINDLYDENNNLIPIEDVVHSDWRKLHDSNGNQGPKEFAVILEKCLEKNKSLLIANPDIFAHESGGNFVNRIVPVFTQGILGKYYEKLGGKVAYFGKPYNGIFEFAKRYAEPDAKILMVGDTPWTDILGANNSGIDSAMVMTGVSGEFLGDSDIITNDSFNYLFEEISPKFSNLEGSVRPKHIIKQFAQQIKNI